MCRCLRHRRAPLARPRPLQPEFSDTPPVSGLRDVVAYFGDALRAAEESALVSQMTPAGPSLTRLYSAPSPDEARARFEAERHKAVEEGGAVPATSSSVSTTVVWGEAEVTAVLTGAIRGWAGGAAAADQATTLAETKFTYEEDAHPELFFAPYVWALAVAYTDKDCAFGSAKAPGGLRLFPPTVSAQALRF